MTDRFAGLHKIPPDPALRLLALANAKLGTPVTAPAAAPVEVVLVELAEQDAWTDVLRLLSVALPVRECIWWGCLAAGDLVDEGQEAPRTLSTARAWVFAPTEENRLAARKAADEAEPNNDTTLAAAACAMCDGKLGSGQLSTYDAPLGAVATFVFALNVMSLGRAVPQTYLAHEQMLIDRALDIGRGGDGQSVFFPKLEQEKVS